MNAREKIVEMVGEGRLTAEEATMILEAMKERPELRPTKSSVRKTVILGIGAGLLALVLFVAVGGWAVSWLWNTTVVSLFHWPVLGFWIALRLTLLLAIVGSVLGLSGRFRYHKKPD